ncbi:MAG: hypothetical protein IPL87_00095 [Candidatus Moraniibacteriota bacterium]|nr:MAG: hypothetical protein IPL87_00095 [Candidatus Moranbacteria bacterium]
MLIDDVTITVKAGRGGDGVVRFARTMMTEGPTGGDGGKGGDVVLCGVNDLGALRVFRSVKEIRAKDGGPGEQNTRTGGGGEDMVVRVPIGTVAHNVTNGQTVEMVSVGQRIVVARGGKGGFGNARFRSSRNTTPEKALPGLPGETWELRLELKMIADVGLLESQMLESRVSSMCSPVPRARWGIIASRRLSPIWAGILMSFSRIFPASSKGQLKERDWDTSFYVTLSERVFCFIWCRRKVMTRSLII